MLQRTMRPRQIYRATSSSPDEVARRLNASVDDQAGWFCQPERVLGSATSDRFRLRTSDPFWHVNSCTMRLEGSVSATSFGSEIRACLVIVPWMIGFLYLWLGFVLLWMAVFSVLAVAAATGGGGDWGVFLAFLCRGSWCGRGARSHAFRRVHRASQRASSGRIA